MDTKEKTLDNFENDFKKAVMVAPEAKREGLMKLSKDDKLKLIDIYNKKVLPKENLLRKLRGHLAYKKQVKPYVIFKDLELWDILREQPKTLDELSTIKGFPREGARVTKWGEAIIAIFNKPKEIEDFEVTLDENGEAEVTVVVKKMEMF